MPSSSRAEGSPRAWIWRWLLAGLLLGALLQRPLQPHLEWRLEQLSRRWMDSPVTTDAGGIVVALRAAKPHERIQYLRRLLFSYKSGAMYEDWVRGMADEYVRRGDLEEARKILVEYGSHRCLLQASDLAEGDQRMALLDRAAAQPATTFARAREQLRRGRLLLSRGDKDGAAAQLSDALPYLGKAERVLGEAALALARDVQGAERATALATLGRRREAEALWAAAGELSGEMTMARAANLRPLFRYRKAIALYRGLIDDERLGPKAMRELAETQVEMQDVGGACKTLNQLIARWPEREAAVLGALRLGDLHVREGEQELARAAYAQVMRLTSSPARQRTAYLSIGWCELRLRRPAEALKAFRGALERTGPSGDRGSVHWGLARAYGELGQSKDAERELRLLVEQSPGHRLLLRALRELRKIRPGATSGVAPDVTPDD